MSPEQIMASKEQMISRLKEVNIRPFSFTMIPTSSSPLDPVSQGLYAISSATGSDHDTMDASLLMSPDYVQPLRSTELAALVQLVFSQDGASWLRHSAARKYVHWRRSEDIPKPMSLYQPLTFAHPRSHSRSSPQVQPGNSQVLTPPMGATSS